MLSGEEIKNAVMQRAIEITVSFHQEGAELKEYNEEISILESSLINNIYSDRLKLTMGPIIKVLNHSAIKSEHRFKNHKNCHDIRKSNNKYIIKPGESVIVLTNERIKLNGNFVCLILPRISMSDVGIIVTTAYVDPFYNGVLRLHLSNLSNKSFELRAVEAIAQCFFFKLTDSVPKLYKEEFSTKSVFYGQTWQGILESDRNPFPIKKEAIAVEKFTNFKYQIQTIWAFIKKHSLIFMLLTNFIVLACGFAVFYQNFNNYIDTMNQVENIFQPTNTEIIINPGEYIGEKEISVNYSKGDIITILCNNENVHYKILSGNMENETVIVFSYVLSSPADAVYEVNFSYTIVRRIK